MNARTALVWLVIAGVLGAVYLWLRATPQQAISTGPIRLGIDPARVVSLERITPDGRTQRVERTGLSDESLRWSVVWTDADGGARSWPASAARVRAGVRVLATAALEPLDVAPAGEVVRMNIGLDDGSSVELDIAARAIGGRVAVSVRKRDSMGVESSTALGWADGSIGAVFADTGLLPWRADELMPRLGNGPTRVELVTGGPRLVIERSGSGWTLREPIAIEADGPSVQRLLGSIHGLTPVGWADSVGLGPAETGLDNPVATIRLTTRAGEGQSLVQELAVGTAANVAGDEVFAAARTRREPNGPDLGPGLARLSSESLRTITSVAEAYIRRVATRYPASDIGGFELSTGGDDPTTAFSRGLDGWTREGEAVRREAQAAIDALLMVLTETPAGHVMVLSDDQSLEQPIGWLTVAGLNQIEIARFELGLGELGGQTMLVVAAVGQPGQLRAAWLYTPETSGAVAAWLMAQLGSDEPGIVGPQPSP